MSIRDWATLLLHQFYWYPNRLNIALFLQEHPGMAWCFTFVAWGIQVGTNSSHLPNLPRVHFINSCPSPLQLFSAYNSDDISGTLFH